MISDFTHKLSSSRPARKLALAVLCSVFALQLLLMIPFVWSQYHHSVNSRVDNERSKLQSVVSFSVPEALNNSQSLISDTLVGLLMTDTAGNPVITQGELPEFENLTQTGNQSSSNRRGSLDVLWFLESDAGRVLATARINTAPLFNRSLWFTVLLTFASLIISALAGYLTLFMMNRNYIRPMNGLADLLRDSRETSKGSVPEKIEYFSSVQLDR